MGLYTGDHVDIRICPVCGNTLTPPFEGGCAICWHGSERGLLVKDDSIGGGEWVHKECLLFWGVESLEQWEKQYIDI